MRLFYFWIFQLEEGWTIDFCSKDLDQVWSVAQGIKKDWSAAGTSSGMSVISVEPAELLTFTLSKGNQSTAAIKIKNTSGGKIVFKVRSESPCYLVY
jgi:hypothetical protein